MKDLINRLCFEDLNPSSEYLAESGWLTDQSPDEFQATIAKYEAMFEDIAAEIKLLLGAPSLTTGDNRAEIDEWYPEAVQAHCWRLNGRFLCLALEHHDRDTPIGIVLKSLTDQEINELKA